MSASNSWLAAAAPAPAPAPAPVEPDLDEFWPAPVSRRLGIPSREELALSAPHAGPTVVVVAGCGAAVGASTLALAVAERGLVRTGGRTTLLDLDDPARSGLLTAADEYGVLLNSTPPATGFRTSQRGSLNILRLNRLTAPLTASEVPAPGTWLALTEDSHLIVVDLAWDLWAEAERPNSTIWAWLDQTVANVKVLMVGRATKPGLLDLERLQATMRRHVLGRQFIAGAQLALLRPQVLGRAGRTSPDLAGRYDDPSVVLVDPDPGLLTEGVSTKPLPAALNHAADLFLDRGGIGPILPDAHSRWKRRSHRRPQ